MEEYSMTMSDTEEIYDGVKERYRPDGVVTLHDAEGNVVFKKHNMITREGRQRIMACLGIGGTSTIFDKNLYLYLMKNNNAVASDTDTYTSLISSGTSLPNTSDLICVEITIEKYDSDYATAKDELGSTTNTSAAIFAPKVEYFDANSHPTDEPYLHIIAKIVGSDINNGSTTINKYGNYTKGGIFRHSTGSGARFLFSELTFPPVGINASTTYYIDYYIYF